MKSVFKKDQKFIVLILCFLFIIVLSLNIYANSKERETIYQVSTLNALFEGIYDGQVSFEDLTKNGDVGIGTFTGLNGEMIQLDGKYYQIKADGLAYPVTETQKTPFALVTYFDSDLEFEITQKYKLQDLTDFLESKLSSENIFYMFKIQGRFSYVKTRSAFKQNKPYPILSEALKNQPTFELENVKGTIVGIRCPQFVKGINLPGYHFHFITEDRTMGGHLLDFDMNNATIKIDFTHNCYLELPDNSNYLKSDLTTDRQQELHDVEK